MKHIKAKLATDDTTEAGPSRLYAPSKRHTVESGPSRLKTSSAFGFQPPGGVRTVASTRSHIGAGVDTTESGPPRLVQFRR
jgi:hypothetical protein